jgi:hypothetical protein
MKVKFLSGPRAGETTHVERTAQNQMLIDCGFLEMIPDQPAPVSNTPSFTIGRLPWSDLPVLVGRVGQRTEFYDGPDPVAYFTRLNLPGLSEEMVAQFKQLQRTKVREQSKPVPGVKITQRS